MEAIGVDMFYSISTSIVKLQATYGFPVKHNENCVICVQNFICVSRIVLYRLGRYPVE
jgi:hypothetical protein